MRTAQERWLCTTSSASVYYNLAATYWYMCLTHESWLHVLLNCVISLSGEGFNMEAGELFCGGCYGESYGATCGGCGSRIGGDQLWVEALDQQWHSHCFTCTVREGGDIYFGSQARVARGSSIMLDRDLNPAAGFSVAQSDCQTSHDTLRPILAQWLLTTMISKM